MRILNNLKIRSKLFLIAMFPVIGLLYFSLSGVIEKSRTASEMEIVQNLSRIAVESSALVHETQKERGLTAGFLGSDGVKFKNELPAQYSTTDSRIRELRELLASIDTESLGHVFETSMSKASDELDRIRSIRSSVSSQSIPASEAIAYYTNLDAVLLDEIAKLPHQTTEADIANQATAYLSFLEAKEFAGIERAVLSSTFAADTFGEGMFEKFSSLVGKQDAFTKIFQLLATEESKNYVNATLKGRAVDEVERMRSIATKNADKGNFGVDASYWFTMITAKIDLLRNIDNYLSENLLAEASDRRSSASQELIIYIISSLLLLLFTAILGVMAAKSITGPIARIGNIAREISQGNINHIIEIHSRDEIGVMASSFRQLVNYLKEFSLVAQEIANNNLTAEVKPVSESDALGNSFKKMLDNLRSVIHRLNENAVTLSSAATEISSSAEQMSKGAASQSDQVGQVSAAVEEMAVTVLQSSKNSADAAEAASAASETAGIGGRIVSSTIQGMQQIQVVVRESSETIVSLSKSAHQIGEIIAVIDDIADQTNLLALNAAIEAARAGEQGRGFAVVADEVRKLAERTGKATAEIAGMIRGIQSDTDGAVDSMDSALKEVDKGRELADQAGNSLNEIVTIVQRVTDMIEQMATAADEQSTASGQIAENMDSIAAITKENATGSEQSAQAAEELNRQAESLKQMVTQFKL